MFDKNFYPTPDILIEKMVKGLFFRTGTKILEPSAGKGDILDYIQTKHSIKSSALFCIEKNTDLQGILRSKGYKLIDSNFLEYKCETTFNFIIMNPPFDHADKHLLKALEVSNGAEIRCLYPTESISNPYSKERKLVIELIDKHNGTVENLGSCFIDSERATNVRVSLISIPKREVKKQFEFANFTSDTAFTMADLETNALESTDVLESIVHRYTKAKEVFVEFLKKKQELEFYTKGLIARDINNIIKETDNSNYDTFFEGFVGELKSSCWKSILEKTKIETLITNKVRKDFNVLIDEQRNLAFTRDNIESLLSLLMSNQGNIMLNCVLDVFDFLTEYHEDNRIYFEGWKTNKSWKVTKRVIVPSVFSSKDVLEFSYYANSDKITDIEKALCFVSGKKYEGIKHNTIRELVTSREKELVTHKDKWGKEYSYYENVRKYLAIGVWHDSEFFKFKGFKKGTLHLEFKDKDVYEKFNKLACQGKSWLPPGGKEI